ncbi:MAG: hypothetical protein AAB049_07265, partial [Nitrospirota bacterium]
MKLGSESGVGEDIRTASSLASLLARLQAQALEPTFDVPRQRALSQALRPYAEYEQQFGLFPLPEEVELASLFLFADYLPEDGQPSLIEQVRDTITTHVPEEERAWLDPLRHSNMDVLEVVSLRGEGRMELRSLGSGKSCQVDAGELSRRCKPGQVLLTRVIRAGDRTVIPGVALVLSASAGRALIDGANEWRRAMEVEAGSFELGEWEEFAKRYGHVLLWRFAQVRLEALVRAEMTIKYRTPSGQPFLYALALYDHHEFSLLNDGLAKLEGWREEPGDPARTSVRSWAQTRDDAELVVARLTLTPAHLFVECESGARLDRVKHQLASAFGFSLHFCGEATEVPPHELPEVNLEEEAPPPCVVVVTKEVEQELLKTFLEAVYMEWADRPSPSLNGQTPRHAMHTAAGRAKVAELIEALERNDLAARRTGKAGYDYNRLRAHVGL